MINARLRQLIATKAQWEAKNPILKSGEIGIEAVYTDGVLVTSKIKVGDGNSTWNELPYATKDTYEYNDLATVNLGDIKIGDDLQGQEIQAILQKILSPYQNPALSNFTINNVSTINYEVGTVIPATLSLKWAVSNIVNLNPTSGILSSSDIDVFTNLGSLNLSPLIYTLNTNAVFTSNILKTITLSLTGKNTKTQAIPTVFAYLKWLGRIRFGVNATGIINTSAHINALGSNVLTDTPVRSYNFNIGYPFIAIPEFIDTTGITFIDNDNGLEFSMKLQSEWDNSLPSLVSYNNGNITFNYKIYRGEFFYNAPTSVKIEK